MDTKLVLGKHDVHVWFTEPNTIDSPKLIERYEALLTDDERESYQRLRMPAHRREFLVSRALLRAVLSEYHEESPAAWLFTRNQYGKPEMSGSTAGIFFNIAHSAGLAACVVSKVSDVGIDSTLR